MDFTIDKFFMQFNYFTDDYILWNSSRDEDYDMLEKADTFAIDSDTFNC
jgi:hypothetical protein